VVVVVFRPACRQTGETAASLFPQAQFTYEFLVFDCILTFKIIQQPATLADHDQETATGMKILFMELEMIRQKIYPFGQERYLYLRRTGILAMGLKGIDDLLFLLVN
jgi:hypothetical protein